MAGDWIKVELVTPDKPEVHQMADLLKIPAEQVLGGLIRIWIWADQQSQTGNALSVTEKTLDRFSCVTGLAKAMRDVGWISGKDGSITLPNFDRHNGKTAKNRALTNSRVKRKRNADTVTNVTHGALPEKRREEGTSSRARKQRASGPNDREDTETAKAARQSTWHAYSTAYFNRYGTEPLRNAQANSLIANFCKAVPMAEAPAIAAFYVAHNKYSYTNSKHDLKIMLAAAHAIHTDWKTGQQSTDSQARRLDQGQAQGSVWAKLQAEKPTP